MNCDELLQKLTDYSEGATDQALCAEIERHLADCTDCEDVREDLERLSRFCRQCEPARLPAEARAEIEALLQRSSSPGPSDR